LTDFAVELRHYCRNPKCRTKLATPVDNPHRAFCRRGCYDRFYARHCRVCDAEVPYREGAEGRICKRSKCRNAVKSRPEAWGWMPTTQKSTEGGKTPTKPGIKMPVKTERNPDWRVVAADGAITANQYYCATVPDGPDCQWRGGEWLRLDARDRAALRIGVQRRRSAPTVAAGAPNAGRALRWGPLSRLGQADAGVLKSPLSCGREVW
jgi:hypothetical protein